MSPLFVSLDIIGLEHRLKLKYKLKYIKVYLDVLLPLELLSSVLESKFNLRETSRKEIIIIQRRTTPQRTINFSCLETLKTVRYITALNYNFEAWLILCARADISWENESAYLCLYNPHRKAFKAGKN